MPVRTYRPPVYEAIDPLVPVIFLAGPIQGAPDWQAEAISIFDNVAKDTLIIANPRRGGKKDEIDYSEQVEWEKYHLKRAAQLGGIVFWLANQDLSEEAMKNYEPGRAYAQTTRIEFGRAIGWRDYDPSINITIGIEPGYKGSEKYYVACANEVQIPVYHHLEDVCVSALRRING